MKSLSLTLDRLLSNPTFEQITGKLILVSQDKSRIILEQKSKKHISLMAPFNDLDFLGLLNKEVIAFVKEGEPVSVFNPKDIPKQQRAKQASPAGEKRKSTSDGTREVTRKAPLLKWVKYAEGRNVGTPVKLASLQRGFELEPELLQAMLNHLRINFDPASRDVQFLDFRRIYHFICSAEYQSFLKDYGPRNIGKGEA